MRSYSIAVLFHCAPDKPDLLEHIQRFRQQLPFAAFYLYCDAPADSMRIALQKLDVTLRHDHSDNRYKVVRRMFTETDADIFVYVGSPDYPAEAASTMIHHLVETRLDMTSAVSPHTVPEDETKYAIMCDGLYGRRLESAMSDYRVFSRRFVKSFSAFERGFPIELEWSIHALELDIPYAEMHFAHDRCFSDVPSGDFKESVRKLLTRIILNFQARPLKWFGIITGVSLVLTLGYKLGLFLEYMGHDTFLDRDVAMVSAASFGIMAFISALSGLLLHSHSHQRRELKRLHFQQHSTL